MDLRLATTEEIAAVASKSDLDIRIPTEAWAFDGSVAFLKQVIELDPVHFKPGASDRHKAAFMWLMRNGLRMRAVPVMYFSVHADDTAWIKNVQAFGCEQVSQQEELRFKSSIIEIPNVNQERNQPNVKLELPVEPVGK